MAFMFIGGQSLHVYGRPRRTDTSNLDFYGKRKVTGSADHRLKVYDHLPDGQWKLIDTWRGHDAEILDVTVTSLIPSILVRIIMILYRRFMLLPSKVEALRGNFF